MKLRSIAVNAAISTALAAGSTMAVMPAQAANLNGLLKISLDGQINSITPTLIDINKPNPTANTSFTLNSGSTGSFADYVGGQITVADIPLPGLPLPNPYNVSIPNFITLSKTGFADITFDLVQLLNPTYFEIGSPIDGQASFNALVRGVFSSGQGNNSTIDALVTFKLAGNSNGGSIELRPIPTPALLPGLLALGVGVLRKRKSEAVEEGAEA